MLSASGSQLALGPHRARCAVGAERCTLWGRTGPAVPLRPALRPHRTQAAQSATQGATRPHRGGPAAGPAVAGQHRTHRSTAGPVCCALSHFLRSRVPQDPSRTECSAEHPPASDGQCLCGPCHWANDARRTAADCRCAPNDALRRAVEGSDNLSCQSFTEKGQSEGTSGMGVAYRTPDASREPLETEPHSAFAIRRTVRNKPQTSMLWRLPAHAVRRSPLAPLPWAFRCTLDRPMLCAFARSVFGVRCRLSDSVRCRTVSVVRRSVFVG
jgi:hypothetical protein